MKFQPGQNVIVLDTTGKPAGTAFIISYNPDSSYYTINFKYYTTERREQLDVPEQRIITNIDFIN